jgi:hypothetical protein
MQILGSEMKAMAHIITPSMEQLAIAMRKYAKKGFYNGRDWTAYFDNARRRHAESGTGLIFTRDIGHHSSGWFKNPDYERCWHLSLSFWDFEQEIARPFEFKLAEAWVRAFYGQDARFVWEEGMTDEHRKKVEALSSAYPEVRHYRVFCDPAWKPIIPRGEVYTKDFTEKGWLSWSDKQHSDKLLKT